MKETPLASDDNGQMTLYGDDQGNLWDMEQEIEKSSDIQIDENTLVEQNDDALSLIKGGKFNVREFYENFDENTERVLESLLKLQSNEFPLKSGGEGIAFRADILIIQNRQCYSAQENTLLDILLGIMSSRPEDSYYELDVDEIAKLLPHYTKKHIYKILKKASKSLHRQPLIFEIMLENGNKQVLEIHWNDILSYVDHKSLNDNEKTHIIFKPTKFFKALAAASTITHGAHFPVALASQIKSPYVKTLFYYLQSRKNTKIHPNAAPGVFTLSFEQLKYILKYPDTYTAYEVRVRILDVAMDELNILKGNDFTFEYEFIYNTDNKTKKKAIGVKFKITKILKDKSVDKPKKIENNIEASPEFTILSAGLHLNNTECKEVLKMYKKYNRNIEFLTSAMTSVLTSNNIISKTAVMCQIMKDGLKSGMSAEENINRNEQQKKKERNQFNEFTQREYDYNELEKALLEIQD